MWFCPVDSLSCEEVDDGAVLLPVRRGPPVGKVRELSPLEYLCSLVWSQNANIAGTAG